MNQSNNNPNEEWRKIFESASETPPPGVWDAIEKHLDEQAKGPAPIPLWRSPAAWLSAASVLLLFGIGTVVYNHNTTVPSVQFAETELSAPAVESIIPEKLAIPSEGAIASAKSEETVNSGSVEATKRPALRSEARSTNRSVNRPSQSVETLLAGNVTQNNLQPGTRSNLIQPAATAEISADASVGKTLDKIDDLPILASLPYEELETYWQTRYVFYNAHAGKMFEDEPLSRGETSPLWAAVSFMPGGYNPNMEFHHQNVYQMNNAVGSPTASNSGFAAQNRTVTGNRDQPKVSYQASAQLGVNLSKNWAIESGVSFLQGNSNSRSPGYYMNNSNTADLLANALISANTAQYSAETMKQLQLPQMESNALAVYVPKDQNVSNNYRFIQVPAYLSYTFQPENRFSYSVLGGGITNVFMQNKLGTTSGYTLKTTRENNVYNSVTLAAAAGLRVNYRISEAWNTNLTANYQQSVTNSFKENDFLKSYPRMYGVSWGVRYTFQN